MPVPSNPDIEGRVRRLGLRYRYALDTRVASPSGGRHEAIVWNPKTRVKGSGSSDWSAAEALAAALETYLFNAGGATSPSSPTPGST
jgi:hypothetical protein